MERSLSEKKLLLISFVIAGYFLLIFLLDLMQVKTQIAQFLVELLTIPFLIAQIVFLLIGISRLLSKNTVSSSLTITSILILAGCCIFTLGSFF